METVTSKEHLITYSLVQSVYLYIIFGYMKDRGVNWLKKGNENF